MSNVTTSKGVAAHGTVYVGAPVLDAQRNNTLFMIYGRGNSRGGMTPFVTASTDAGASWSAPRSSGLCTTGNAVANPGPGAGLQLASGRLVVPVQTSNCAGSNDTTHAGAMYSDDHGGPKIASPPSLCLGMFCTEASHASAAGVTWKQSSPVVGPGETQLALTSHGTLLTIGHGDRKTERYQMFAESADGGVSWGAVRRASDLVNVGSQQSMVSATEADGRHFLYYAASHGLLLGLDEFDEVTSRRDGVVKYSQDDGKTWWLLEPAVLRAGPFMYSGIVRRGGNLSHVTLGFVFEGFAGDCPRPSRGG